MLPRLVVDPQGEHMQQEKGGCSEFDEGEIQVVLL